MGLSHIVKAYNIILISKTTNNSNEKKYLGMFLFVSPDLISKFKNSLRKQAFLQYLTFSCFIVTSN